MLRHPHAVPVNISMLRPCCSSGLGPFLSPAGKTIMVHLPVSGVCGAHLLSYLRQSHLEVMVTHPLCFPDVHTHTYRCVQNIHALYSTAFHVACSCRGKCPWAPQSQGHHIVLVYPGISSTSSLPPRVAGHLIRVH